MPRQELNTPPKDFQLIIKVHASDNRNDANALKKATDFETIVTRYPLSIGETTLTYVSKDDQHNFYFK